VCLPTGDAAPGRVPEHVRALETEVAVLRTLRHENIVRYLGTGRDGDAVCVFLEYVQGGSIAGLLAKFGPFSEAVIRSYTRQVLRGLEYLHARGIVHRDTKVGGARRGGCGRSSFGLGRAALGPGVLWASSICAGLRFAWLGCAGLRVSMVPRNPVC
jgi:serine/threonine protein kinase